LAEIRNPNLQTPGSSGSSGGGGSMGTTMALMLLVLIILMGYDYFKPKPAVPNAPPQNQQQSAQTPVSQPQLPSGSLSGAAQPAAQQASAAPQVTAASETKTTVENAQYTIVFTNRGAQIEHWILKNYSDATGKPLDLVQPQAAARFGLPLSFFTYDKGLTDQLNQALYQVSATGVSTTGDLQVAKDGSSALAFHYAAGGLDVVKTIRFDQSYVLTIESQVTRNGSPVRALLSWPAGLGDMDEFLPAHTGASSGYQVRLSASSLFAWSIDGKQDSEKVSKVAGNATLDLPYEYAAIEDLYFTAAFLPDTPGRITTVTLHNAIDIPADPSDPNSQKKPADLLGLAMGDQSGVTRLRLYAGPKQLDVLKTIHVTAADGKPGETTLAPLIQFGMWTVIAKPMYLALRFLHSHLTGPNAWGWSIIIVTFFINLCMFPTRWYMLKSSVKMARIQPKVEALKRRYAHLKATDPKKAEMNTEMMALYKQEGVNMYGSCLPMLIQMPLLYAIYRVLANAVELRQAHWFWLHDLSSADPLYILPAIIVVGMLVVQLISPAPGMDHNQRRMMAIMMPAIFGFTMIHFASGLALYWGTGNVINLVMQLAINQSPMGKELHEIAAKRAAKKLPPGGGPRTIQGRR
jgi:YidC/Oxa1 family membrane protein insertase